MMKIESIKELLATISQYETVKITQTFTKNDTGWIAVRYLSETKNFELTYMQTQTIEYYESVDEVAEIIDKQVNSSSPT